MSTDAAAVVAGAAAAVVSGTPAAAVVSTAAGASVAAGAVVAAAAAAAMSRGHSPAVDPPGSVVAPVAVVPIINVAVTASTVAAAPFVRLIARLPKASRVVLAT